MLSLCPSLPDAFVRDYKDARGTNMNVLSGYKNSSFNNKYLSRGCFPVTIFGFKGTNNPIEVISGKVMDVIIAGDSVPEYDYITLTFTSTEPLLFLSPFISGYSNSNAAGLVGINNMNIVCNIGNCNKVFSTMSSAKTVISEITLTDLKESKILLNFISLPASIYDKVAAKNIVNYQQYQAYDYNTGRAVVPGDHQITFSNIQLNQIPSKMIIICRKPLANQNWSDTNSFLPIKNITMNFNNKSGILASANQQQLFNMSKRNGLQGNFYEFSGRACAGVSESAITGNTGVTATVFTSGAVLVIDPALDLGMAASYSNMSGGQFNVQFNVTCEATEAMPNGIEVVLICVNSGIFITKTGTSNIETALLSQEMVLETRSKPAVMDSLSYNKIVGGACENIASVHKHLKHLFRPQQLSTPSANTESGSAMSAGAACGGSTVSSSRRLHKYYK